MAVKQYGLAGVTANKQNVVTSVPASDATNGVRVIIDDSIVTSKNAALIAIEVIEQSIREDTWPLA